MSRALVGIVDTGVNPWHSHVRTQIEGCRLRIDDRGCILRDDDFLDSLGHGTAVAGVIRENAPSAAIFAVNVFGDQQSTYPTLVARGIQECLIAGCDIIVLCLAMPAGPGTQALLAACDEAHRHGVSLVAAGDPDRPELLPAAHPEVIGVMADGSLRQDAVVTDRNGPFPIACYGGPRDLPGVPREANLWGHSFACARYAAHLAHKLSP